MNNLKLWAVKNKHFFILFLFLPVLLNFYLCEKNIYPKYIMHSSIDDHIPFIKQFIILYLMWFVYIFFGFLYLGLKSKDQFIQLFFFIFIGMSFSLLIYIIFPNAQNLRPVITQNDIFSKIVKAIYAIDTPTNVCPSIHVINAIGIHGALRNSEKFRNNKWRTICSFTLMISICISTLFVKQHSIIDVSLGTMFGSILYVSIFIIPVKIRGNYKKIDIVEK